MSETIKMWRILDKQPDIIDMEDESTLGYGRVTVHVPNEKWAALLVRQQNVLLDRLQAAERAKEEAQAELTELRVQRSLAHGAEIDSREQIKGLRAQLLAAERDRDAAELVLSGTITQCREFKGGRWCDLTVAPDDGVMEIVMTVKVPTVAIGRRVEVRVAAQPEKEGRAGAEDRPW